MSNTPKKDIKKVSEAAWIEKAKTILGEQAFNKSPLKIIATKEWANSCTLEHKKGIFIEAGKELDCIYMLIKGRVGIGGKSGPYDNYYVERLILEPFSFIGEIEAPCKIGNQVFNKLAFQDYAWVSSQLLSMLIAWDDKDYKIKISDYDSKLSLLKYMEDVDKCPKLLANKNKKEPMPEICQVNSDSCRIKDEACEVSKYNIYTQGDNASASLLRIPLKHSESIFTDTVLCNQIYQEAFIKSKKYCYIADMPKLGDKIISIYNYAEINKLLVDGSLYIIDKHRLNAVTSMSDAHKKISVTKGHLESKGFKLVEMHSRVTDPLLRPKKDNIKSLLPNLLLAEVWNIDSGNHVSNTHGGNKAIYKISRVSNG